jgi:ferritin-like metal-binding protein YciE
LYLFQPKTQIIMKLETLRKLYVTELRSLYSAEKQILVGLKKMKAAAHHEELKQAFEQHYSETEGQIERLKQIFDRLGESPKGETSRAALGLLAEGDKIIKARGESDVIDAGLIAAAQKIEHNEIACYGTAIAYGKQLGDQESVSLLEQSLDEEYATDKRLTAMAEGSINREASYSSGYTTGYYEDNYTESNSGISVTGLLLGAAAGVAVGMLLAPSTGNDFRRKISTQANNLFDQFGGQLGSVSDVAKSLIEKFTAAQGGSSAGNNPNQNPNPNPAPNSNPNPQSYNSPYGQGGPKF